MSDEIIDQLNDWKHQLDKLPKAIGLPVPPDLPTGLPPAKDRRVIIDAEYKVIE
jgi:hypothetical protein